MADRELDAGPSHGLDLRATRLLGPATSDSGSAPRRGVRANYRPHVPLSMARSFRWLIGSGRLGGTSEQALKFRKEAIRRDASLTQIVGRRPHPS